MTKSNWRHGRASATEHGDPARRGQRDAGVLEPRQVTDPRAAGIDLHVATGRVRNGASPKSSPAARRSG